MTQISTSPARSIISDFAKEIHTRKRKGPKPEKHVINFRNERRNNFERDVWLVPLDRLRYRKDNGRIASDVLGYEKHHGILKENTEEAQRLLRTFLEEKDKQKTEELLRSMEHDGQRDPAIITTDGFLINGNRRKMVLERLLENNKGDPRFSEMKVVILPGEGDEGGAPTLREIEEIENRYQLQSDGKSEYYGFDRALSIRRKLRFGMSLEEQLRDDPTYTSLSAPEFNKVVKKFKDDYLMPLECVDEYLSHLNREGLYETVSSGQSDREGRWQAFVDYSNFHNQLMQEGKRVEWGVSSKEVGIIKDVAFKLIRKRELSKSESGLATGLPKVHSVMRSLPRLLKNKDAKRELLKLKEIDIDLPQSEKQDAQKREYDEREIDKVWGNRYATEITRQVKRALQSYEHSKEREMPLTLLRAALEKLNQEDMEDPTLNIGDIEEAMKLSIHIRDRAKELETKFYHQLKDMKGLTGKDDS
jgi:hypothetical protein